MRLSGAVFTGGLKGNDYIPPISKKRQATGANKKSLKWGDLANHKLPNSDLMRIWGKKAGALVNYRYKHLNPVWNAKTDKENSDYQNALAEEQRKVVEYNSNKNTPL